MQGSELYLGEFDHALDNQCRVTLPSDWRNRDGGTELVLIPAREGALVLLPLALRLWLQAEPVMARSRHLRLPAKIYPLCWQVMPAAQH